MRIVVDLDGTICNLKDPNLSFEAYAHVKPLPGAVETLRKLKREGHYIIVHTSRHMKTCEGDVGMVKRRIGRLTIDWLSQYSVPYDEIHFGKPYGDVYIDDLAITFQGWDKLSPEKFQEEK